MMIKKLILTPLFCCVLMGLGQLSAQTIDLLGNNDNPGNPRGVCQCDTLAVNYFISSPGFALGSDFYYEFANPNNNWASADSLELTAHSPNILATDTVSAGNKAVMLYVPCDAQLGSTTLRVRNSNGVISDTLFYTVNKIPDTAYIESITLGFPTNPYTTTLNDYGFCEGDSVILRAFASGTGYQWLLNGGPIVGETDTSLVVKTSGTYSVRIDLGACSKTSPDTIINAFKPPTNISLFSAPPVAFQIDRPAMNPLDSVLFCENSAAIMRGPAPAPATGLTFEYQWLTDSITQFGDRVYYSLGGDDTSEFYSIDTAGRFYLVVNDGFCIDTSAMPYYAFEDTIVDTEITHRIYSGGIPGPIMTGTDICMKDSILLSTPVGILLQPDTVEFQWQRYNTSSDVWEDLPNAVNPGLDGDNYTLQVDTSIKPIQALSFYRLQTWTLTPFNFQRVCSYTTDSVVVRWFPEYDLTFQNQPFVYNVATTGQDSISFCETDSATIVAPSTPLQLFNNGFFYSYQWYQDSLDTAIGGFVKVPIIGATGQTLQVKDEGRYYVFIDDGICIDTSDMFRVFVDSVPVITPSAASTTNLCLDDAVTLAADTVVGWQYQWQIFRDPAAGWFNSPNDTLPFLNVDTAFRTGGFDTMYFRLNIQYENRFGLTICPYTSDSIQVIFFPPPTITFFPGDLLGICPGDSVLVIAQGNSLSYLWDDGTIGPSNWLSTPGVHKVTGTGLNGCTAEDSVTVFELPSVADAGADVTAMSGEVVTLTGAGGNDYYWFSDTPLAWGSILNRSTTVSYDLPEGVLSDTIEIFLRVRTDDGCEAFDSLTFIVNADEEEPDEDTDLLTRSYNFFSPNNDGMNDVWDISSIVGDYNACSIDILNRWGSTVFQQEVFTGVWDGNDEGGNPLPDGTYYYILFCDGNVLLKQPVTLIRSNN